MSKAERGARSAAAIMRAAARLIVRQGYGKTRASSRSAWQRATAAPSSAPFGVERGPVTGAPQAHHDAFSDDQIGPTLACKKGLEALCADVDAYLRELKEREDRVRIFYVLMGEGLGAVREVLPSFARLNETLRADAEQRIRGGIEAGEFRADVDPELEAVAFLATLRGTALQWLVDHKGFDLDRVREGLVDKGSASKGPMPLRACARINLHDHCRHSMV